MFKKATNHIFIFQKRQIGVSSSVTESDDDRDAEIVAMVRKLRDYFRADKTAFNFHAEGSLCWI